jgi:hypothetical protein
MLGADKRLLHWPLIFSGRIIGSTTSLALGCGEGDPYGGGDGDGDWGNGRGDGASSPLGGARDLNRHKDYGTGCGFANGLDGDGKGRKHD